MTGDTSTLLAIGIAGFGLGVMVGRRRRREECDAGGSTIQSTAGALLLTADYVNRLRPVLEPIAAGRSAGVSDYAAMARGLGGGR